jgi:hypothetical protein
MLLSDAALTPRPSLVTSQVYWNKKDPAKRKPTLERFQPPPELWRLVSKFEDVMVAKGG